MGTESRGVIVSEVVERPYRAHRALRRWDFYRERAFAVGHDLAARVGRPVNDSRMGRLGRNGRIVRMEVGQSHRSGKQVAVYAHYIRSGRITHMIRVQLEEYRRLGFDIAFVTMSENIGPDDWVTLTGLCSLVIQRRSFGRDFGAWADAIPEVMRLSPDAEEVLLVNDSVLGPVRDLVPFLGRMRTEPGVWGLIESFQGGAHLQSFFLLIRGASAVADLLKFLSCLQLSNDKVAMINRGEVGFTASMRDRGHHVRAVIPYEMLETAALEDPDHRAALAASLPWLFKARRGIEFGDNSPKYRLRRRLYDTPVNPTHQFWRCLVSDFGFPFIKAELLLVNPTRMPDVPEWRALVDESSPCNAEVIDAHLVETLRCCIP